MFNVAIDGPSGAGKSTISRKVAKDLGLIYIDTGSLYRTVGLHVLGAGKRTDVVEDVEPLLAEITVDFKHVNSTQRLYLNGKDVTEDIRKPECSMAASNVSAIPAVRAFLLDMQREVAAKINCVMDGRDIGTVVLPGAQLKIFLTASSEDRAMRRYEELKFKGFDVNFDTIHDEIKTRDFNDSNREIAPLKQADDAMLVDTTGNEFAESVEIIKSIIKEKMDEIL